jgi:hypothetical protein
MCNAIVKPELEALVTDFYGIADIFSMLEEKIDDIKAPMSAYTLALKSFKERITSLNTAIEQL